jgi:hypothetical protein
MTRLIEVLERIAVALETIAKASQPQPKQQRPPETNDERKARLLTETRSH